MRRMCCVCQRTECGGQWWSLPAPAKAEMVTHGYCPDCHAQVMAEIQRFSQRRTAGNQREQGLVWATTARVGAACV